jgi:hypothetical protein
MAKNEINKNRLGLTLGILFTIMHVLWVILVWAGLGKSLADWVHAIHFLGDMNVITNVRLGMIVIGIITAFVSGYILGWVFAAIWNLVGEKLK